MRFHFLSQSKWFNLQLIICWIFFPSNLNFILSNIHTSLQSLLPIVLHSYRIDNSLTYMCVVSHFPAYCPSGLHLLLNHKRSLHLHIYIIFNDSHLQIESFILLVYHQNVHCSTCPIEIDFELRLAYVTLPATCSRRSSTRDKLPWIRQLWQLS